MDYEKILNEAVAAATAAIRAKFDAGEQEQPFNCGFAWVQIDGTSGLARYCRAKVKEAGGEHVADFRYGSKGYPNGWQFWGPGEWPRSRDVGRRVYTQDMDFHFAGAQAFVKSLAEHGIRASARCKLD